MPHAPRRHLDRSELGFTLIELMVVVLIIAILLAIAIPTFLGARTRAQDRAAQSNIRNALTAEKTYYTDSQQYGDPGVATNLTALQGIEPAIGWTAGLAVQVGQVGVVTAPENSSAPAVNDNAIFASKSASGTCFYEMDEGILGTTTLVGTWYAVNKGCTAPLPALAAPAPTTKAVDGGATSTWGTGF